MRQSQTRQLHGRRLKERALARPAITRAEPTVYRTGDVATGGVTVFAEA